MTVWISQTYITNLRADGAVAAYFLFESYRDDHAKIERLIRPKLADLARSFGNNAHVYVPNEDNRAGIGKEINDWIQAHGYRNIELPGILILDRALALDEAPSNEARFISLKGLIGSPDRADDFMTKLKCAFDEVYESMKGGSRLSAVLRNAQVKPNIWGIGYDFTPYVNKARKWLDKR